MTGEPALSDKMGAGVAHFVAEAIGANVQIAASNKITVVDGDARADSINVSDVSVSRSVVSPSCIQASAASPCFG